MAKAELDRSPAGTRGKIGRLVFRQQHGQTVIVPLRHRADKPTTAQLDRRRRFREAQAYAARVIADPLKRECYRRLAAERKCPVNALLAANFLNPPVIDHVELDEYHGRAGDPIRVLATDLVEVVGVTVRVRTAADATLEGGAAAKDHDVWVYPSSRSRACRGVAARPEGLPDHGASLLRVSLKRFERGSSGAKSFSAGELAIVDRYGAGRSRRYFCGSCALCGSCI